MNLERFARKYPPTTPVEGSPVYYLPFVAGRDLVVLQGGGNAVFLDGQIGGALPFAVQGAEPLYLGEFDGAACLAYLADEIAVAEAGTSATGLRNLYGVLSDDEYAVAGFAAHLLHWQTISRFCPKCGGATTETTNAWAKTCTVCAYAPYPVVSPAVLMLVHDGGNRVLLSHKAGWGDRWSILAGFVEPGETMEQCVERETFEEVGLRVTGITYRGSQPWAYPHQLMIGFTAQAVDANAPLVVDETELDGAQWFDANALPALPGKLSLSRQLLDEWLAGNAGNPNAPGF